MAKTVKPEESFSNLYIGECLKSESEISATHRMRRIFDAKNEKANINKVMIKKYQHLNTE